jgi:hypothetical protein
MQSSAKSATITQKPTMNNPTTAMRELNKISMVALNFSVRVGAALTAGGAVVPVTVISSPYA